MNTLIGFSAIVLVIVISYFIGWVIARVEGDATYDHINKIWVGFFALIILGILGISIVLIYKICGILGEITQNLFK